MFRVVRTSFMLALVAFAAAFVAVPVAASSDEPELFMTHVRFEALRSLRRRAVDPQVFIREQQGYRPARNGDDPSLPLYTAHGDALSLNLGHWFGASGTVRFLNGPGVPVRDVRFSFTGLVPFGVYSIFVSRSTPDTVEIMPFAQRTESLKASIDGSIVLAALAEIPLLDGDLIWLVYHSDGVAHGNRLGELGVTAHEQLLLPVRISPPATPPVSVKEPVKAPPPPSPSPSPLPSFPSSPSPFPTLPPVPVTMVNQGEGTPPSDAPTAIATASPSADDDDLYVPLDRASTPAPTGQPSPAPSATPTPAASATPVASASPTESPMESPTESPSPMPTEPTF